MRGRLTLVVFVCMLLLNVAGLATMIQAQDRPQLDRSAPFRTLVPHRDFLGTQANIPGTASQTSTRRGGFSGHPYKVGQTVTPTTSGPEAEEEIAADPNNSKNLVAMINDYSLRGAFNTAKFSVSKNGGKTWKDSFIPLSGGSPATSDGAVWQATSDPVVAFDKLGNLFLTLLYIDVSGQNISHDGYYVCSTKFSSGPTFNSSDCRPVKTNLKPTSLLEDKPWIAVDNSNSKFSGRVYASWTHFVGNTTSYIWLSRSTDHAKTWSKPIHINPSSQNGAIQGSQVAVGPKGEVYVSYEVFLTGGQGQHFIAKSTDGGKSFSKPVALTPVFNNLTFCVSYRCNSFSALAVNPKTGFVYDVYTDQPSANAATEFVRSKTAGGLTFANPVKVNDSSKGQRLMPAVAADSNGVVHMSWFDTRRNPSNPDLLDIFATFTKDNGASFSPNARANSKPITTSANDFIGDYSGLAAGTSGKTSLAHPVWTSAGLNERPSNMQSSTLTVP